MPRQRDPLSVLYDGFSAEFLGLLRADMVTWYSATVRSPRGDPVDARGLSRTERAVTRSLYYVLNSTGAVGPQGGSWVKNPDESLQLRWSDPVTEGGLIARLLGRGTRARTVQGRLMLGQLAHNFVDPATAYVFNPAEQSQALQL